MARPAKAVDTTSKHLTKEEYEIRKTTEEKLKGNANRIKAPSFLNTQQKKIFKVIVEELKGANILGNVDIYVLSTCSIAINRIQDIEQMINNDIELLQNKELMGAKDKYTKDFFRCCTELSLSPASRAKLGTINLQKKQDEEDPVIKAMRGEID